MGCAARIAWALASCMLAVGSGQDLPPCALDPSTLDGRGATLREYAEPDPRRIYCHLEHVCDNAPIGNACVIPDDESCLVDATRATKTAITTTRTSCTAGPETEGICRS
jgi:hypothetical protein